MPRLSHGSRPRESRRRKEAIGMRKAYQKPLLYAESYELSQHIAACDIKLTYESMWNCAGKPQKPPFDKLPFPLFITPKVCFENNRTNNASIEMYCYTNGIAGFATHMS